MRKRYIYTCAGCGLISESGRSDTLTCSPACRVRAHRSGRLKELRALAKTLALTDARTGKLKVAPMLQAAAIQKLRPDLADQLQQGTLTIFQAMPEVCEAYDKLVFQLLLKERE